MVIKRVLGEVADKEWTAHVHTKDFGKAYKAVLGIAVWDSAIIAP